eukprot:TRINITY_DN71672_c0_g1_i1.p1 TRINITY_DN71672_c0_g1~~TRINITY_DN71672_c0_g1_i1.p1  ORF type:complete len:207 (+),score=17.64 TRINITY_DN71672_c0_g1_i1:86-622(+)
MAPGAGALYPRSSRRHHHGRRRTWMDGVVSSVGEHPTLTTADGEVVRFAYRCLKRFGGGKVTLRVGDELGFMLQKQTQPGALRKASQVFVKRQVSEPTSPSGRSQSTTSESSAPAGSNSPEDPSGGPSPRTSPGTERGTSDSLPTQQSSTWVHDPYSWLRSTRSTASPAATVTTAGTL